MIVSHRHQFIFLKTRKTAGTSVEIALSRFCGPDDIVTAIDEADEQIRAERGGHGPQNDLVPLNRLTLRQKARWIRGRGRVRLHNHMTAAQVRDAVGDEVWQRYTKISIERNPWDAMVSLYHWAIRGVDDPPEFKEFLMLPRASRLAGNFDIYAIDGRIEADHIVRFESLADDLADAAAAVGLSEPLDLPRAKGSVRPQGDYTQYYDPATTELVAAMCRRQIDALGYRFGAQ